MFDVLTIAAIADELNQTVLDGRIQRLGHLDARSILLELYNPGRRRYLVLSANNDDPRALLQDREPSIDSQLVSPFLLLLRKYARGGFLVGIEQPPLERILRFSIAKRLRPHNGPPTDPAASVNLAEADDSDTELDEEGLTGATFIHLIVEIMGRHSNLILVDDDGRIMDSVKRVTPAMSRVRPIQPRLPYRPPPPIDRPDPRRLTASEAARMLAGEPPSARIAAALTRRLRAISPQLGREIAFRVTGDANAGIERLQADDGAALARETRNLFEPLLTSVWRPAIYRDDDGVVIAFAPVSMAHLAAAHGEEPVASISRAAELAAGETDASPQRHAQRRERLSQAIRAARDRIDARLAALQTEARKAGDVERLRESGELIYAYLWQIAPGQRLLEIDGRSIALDPALSAKENAQAYFERYRKAQSAGAHLPALIETTERERAYVDQVLTLVAQADRFEDLESLAVEWSATHGGTAAGGPGKRPVKRSTPARRPRPLLDAAGNAIYIGRSGAQNDAVTFDIAGPNDTWLHARGVPGSHVIVRWRDAAGAEEPRTLETAAALAAFYSAARAGGAVEVDLTRRRFVRKIKGAGPGLVTYRNERTIAVRPADERALGLADAR